MSLRHRHGYFSMRMSLPVIITLMFLAGCSYTLHERDKDLNDPSDQGSKTELKLRGPKAVVKHSF